MKEIVPLLALTGLLLGLMCWTATPRKVKAQSASAQFSRAVGVFDSAKYNRGARLSWRATARLVRRRLRFAPPWWRCQMAE
jgi:hypothetical protein